MLPLFSDYLSLDAVAAACSRCVACTLSAGRTQVVFGAGDPRAKLMLIGHGPSLTDDQTGVPYSGPAGDLLDTALTQAGLRRDEIWITNLHKCIATRIDKQMGRSVQRPPHVEEITACAPWLEQEILWVQPRVLVAIGGPAAQVLLGKELKLTGQRGQWQTGPHGLPTMGIVQPVYLKRLNEHDRPAAVQGWRDLVADLRRAAERAAQPD